MSKIFLSSDSHFGHDKSFIYEARGFSSIEEMNEEYIKRWNEVVGINDDIYHLGDIVLGARENIKMLERVNGKIHLIRGNHDSRARIEIYKTLPNIVEIVDARYLEYKKYYFFLCHFPSMTDHLQKETLKQMTINLHGHTHQKENFSYNLPFMYHVGVDSHDGYPICIDDVIEEMNKYYNNFYI